MDRVPGDEVEGTWTQWRALGFLAVAELLGMTLWFSASAVVPTLEKDWGLSSASSAWLTMSVQIGFVAGTLLSATLNLPDMVNSRRLFAVSAFLGAATNATFALLASGLAVGVALRFLTGMFLAGVYPPGMKLAATWSRQYRGFAIGLLVGALTVGSASPHLVRSIGDLHWQSVVLVSSALATLGGAMVLALVRDGPFTAAAARFDPRAAIRFMAQRGVRLANFGYLGHMWELYAMWTWVPIFLTEALELRSGSPAQAGLIAFGVIAIGGPGSVAAGIIADLVGRTAVTSGAMNTERGHGAARGRAFRCSVAGPCACPAGSIQLVPLFVDSSGWSLAFVVLALGPAFGVWAMLRLRGLPEASRLAGGRR